MALSHARENETRQAKPDSEGDEYRNQRGRTGDKYDEASGSGGEKSQEIIGAGFHGNAGADQTGADPHPFDPLLLGFDVLNRVLHLLLAYLERLGRTLAQYSLTLRHIVDALVRFSLAARVGDRQHIYKATNADAGQQHGCELCNFRSEQSVLLMDARAHRLLRTM